MAHPIRDRIDLPAGVAALTDRRKLAQLSDQYVLMTEGWPWLARETAKPGGPDMQPPARGRGRTDH